MLEHTFNGHKTEATAKKMVEPEMVSPQVLAEMWGYEVELVWGWVAAAKKGKTDDPFPFEQAPGSRLIRIPLKEARAWLRRGKRR